MTRHDAPSAVVMFCKVCGERRRTFVAGEGGTVAPGTLCCAVCQFSLRSPAVHDALTKAREALLRKP